MRFFQRRDDQRKIEAIRGLLKQTAEAFERGQIDESAECATHANSLAGDLGRAGDQLRCSALSSMAAVATRRGEIEHAEASLDAATEIIAANHWQYTSRHYWVMINSAVLNWTRGDKDAALNILTHAYQELTSRASFQGRNEIHVRLLENMCGYSLETGAFVEASRWITLAREQLQATDANYPRHLANFFYLQTRVAVETGKVATTLGALAEEADLIKSLIGSDHPAMALVGASLSLALMQVGKMDEASEILDRAYEQLGQESGLLAKSLILNGRGMVALRQKRFQDAETVFRDELSVVGNMSGKRTEGRYSISLNNIGVAIREQNRLLEAETFLQQAIKVGQSTFGPDHFHTANAMKNLAQTYARAGRVNEAIELCQTAISRFEKSQRAAGPATSAKLAEARELLAQLEGR